MARIKTFYKAHQQPVKFSRSGYLSDDIKVLKSRSIVGAILGQEYLSSLFEDSDNYDVYSVPRDHKPLYFKKGDVWCRDLRCGQDWSFILEDLSEDILVPRGSYILRPLRPHDSRTPPASLIWSLHKYHSRGWQRTCASYTKRYPTSSIYETEIPEFSDEDALIIEKTIPVIESLVEQQKQVAKLTGQIGECLAHRFASGKSVKGDAQKSFKMLSRRV